MYTQIQVAEKTALIHLSSGWGPGPHIKLTGATFPIAPTGTIMDKFSVKVPEGLHAVAFFCRVEGPHEKGSGKTRYLDYTPQIGASVLLSWEEENGKLIVKADKDMSLAELGKFNSFVRSDADIFVVDSERKTTYISNYPVSSADPAWNYKLVPMEAILGYIVKKLTMEQLDERATSEWLARVELAELKKENSRLLDVAANQFEKSLKLLQRNDKLAEAVNSANCLWLLLGKLPAKIQPRWFKQFRTNLEEYNQLPEVQLF